jgi:Fe-S oxidoreductase
MWMEETLGTRINHDRVGEALDTGSDTLVAACPFCLIMLDDGLAAKEKQDQLALKDVSELLLESLSDEVPDES